MKKIIIFLSILTVIIVAVVMTQKIPEQVSQENDTVVRLCFYKEVPTESGFSDRAWLRLNLLDEQVFGEFYNLPAQKDSKFGEFSGVVTPVDDMSMTRTIDAWWEAEAEGMVTTEELRIVFGEGTASVGFGEMVDQGDGVYVYKDINSIGYWQDLTDISCEDLDDRILVEAHLRENIRSLISQEPVLGGSWYVVSVTLNAFENTGRVVYEDGHIQGMADFQYERNGQEVKIISLAEIME